MGYLSDIARRRIAAAILIVGTVLAILAVADVGPFSDPPSEEERAGDAVREFFAAAAGGDFARYCELLTDTARDAVRAGAARVLETSEQRLSCPEIAALAKDRFAGLEVRVRHVSISGNRARVEALLKPEGQSAQFRTILLELDESGNWLVADQG